MISKPLLKHTIKTSYKVFLIFTAVLTMYFVVIIAMFDPETQESLKEMVKILPAELISAFGFDLSETSLTGFLSSYLYGMLMLLLPMIYEIIVAINLVSKYVDKGSMAYLLSTPNKRTKIVLTQMLFLLFSLVLMIAYVTCLTIAICKAIFPGQLDITKFILLNLGALLLHFTISAVAFFASCVFNEKRNVTAIAAGFPIAFFIIQMLANVGGNLDFLKYLTIFTLFDTSAVISGDSVLLPYTILLLLAAVLYFAGIAVFNKKDLHI